MAERTTPHHRKLCGAEMLARIERDGCVAWLDEARVKLMNLTSEVIILRDAKCKGANDK